MNTPFGLGAFESPNDPRTYIHENSYDKVDILPNTYAYTYVVGDILHQHKIGKCTSSSFIQLANKARGIKYSDDFQYLLQKKLIDKNWIEGSYVSAAPATALKYGMLPIEYFPSITDENPEITYEEYIAKLQQVSDADLQKLLKIAAKHKIGGYARVDHTDKFAVAKGLLDSKVGLLTRYEVTSDWYTDTNGNITWAYALISPLRNNGKVISGHAIGNTGYDYTTGRFHRLTNTWGKDYGKKGSVEADYNVVGMKEAWIIYWDKAPETVKPTQVKYVFNNDLKYGQSNDEVKFLQLFLIQKGLLAEGLATGYYGELTKNAVLAYQKSKKMMFTSGKIVGIVTRYFINQETK